MTAAAVIAAAACTDDSATSPMGPESASSTVADVVPIVAGADAAIEDAMIRIVPALSDPAGAEGLMAALGAVQTQLASADVASLRGAIAATWNLIDAYASSVGEAGGDAADLDVVRLALESLKS